MPTNGHEFAIDFGTGEGRSLAAAPEAYVRGLFPLGDEYAEPTTALSFQALEKALLRGQLDSRMARGVEVASTKILD